MWLRFVSQNRGISVEKCLPTGEYVEFVCTVGSDRQVTRLLRLLGLSDDAITACMNRYPHTIEIEDSTVPGEEPTDAQIPNHDGC